MLSSAVPPEFSLEAARRAESAGFARLWVTEDYFRKGAFSTAGAMLAVTERLCIALGVASVYARGLATLAMESSTLRAMFPERFELGVGTGLMSKVRRFGRQPTKLIGSLDHRMAGLRGLLEGESVSWSDEFDALDEVQLEFPRDVGPLWIAAEGPQMLRLAARRADGLVYSSLATPAYLRWAAGRVGDILEAREHRLPQAAFMYVMVDADDELAYRRALRYLAVRLDGYHGGPLMEQSDHAEVIAAAAALPIEERATLLTPEVVAAYVPFGSVIPERLQAMFDAGITELAIAPIPPERPAEVLDAIEELGHLAGGDVGAPSAPAS
jgi:alkanesulfonate monooxygenase SsuD/methylene tetrahydromethanopterin reductase-like flavin-dependent oxidoreductase (luciferase family)